MKTVVLLVAALVALPVVSALPLAIVCGEDCRINAASFPGYDPVLAVIASGSSVTFHSTDIGHITYDIGMGTTPGSCFFVEHEQGSDSLPVRFDVADGALSATVDGETATCTNAQDAAAGFVLQYQCALHPGMRGALVVTP